MSKHRHKKKHRHEHGRNHHHLIPKCRGGRDLPNNLLLINATRHELFHKIFGVRTLDEVIALLVRLRRIKSYQYAKEWGTRKVCNLQQGTLSFRESS